MKPKLIPDARKAWKWLSIQIPALNLAFLATWAALPPKFQDALSPPWVVAIAGFLIAAGMVGRLVKQGKEQ